MLEQALGRPTVRARAATDQDAPSEILELGTDFEFLKIEDDGRLTTTLEVGPTTPIRIVVDADSYLRGAVDREHAAADGSGQWTIIALSRTAIIEIPVAAPKPGGQSERSA